MVGVTTLKRTNVKRETGKTVPYNGLTNQSRFKSGLPFKKATENLQQQM